MDKKETYELNTKVLFKYVMDGLMTGALTPKLQAKCVCVNKIDVTDEMVGTEHIVWSHNQIEKTLKLEKGMVLIETLDKDGNPVVDEGGHKNIYDMKAEKFAKKYPRQINGHYAQDGTPMITVELPDGFIPKEGITVLPPNWGGYEGTLMQGGLIMLPYDPTKTLNQMIDMWSKEGATKLDWYPNNEAHTYAPCDRFGNFKDDNLRKLFTQKTNNTTKDL